MVEERIDAGPVEVEIKFHLDEGDDEQVAEVANLLVAELAQVAAAVLRAHGLKPWSLGRTVGGVTAAPLREL